MTYRLRDKPSLVIQAHVKELIELHCALRKERSLPDISAAILSELEQKSILLSQLTLVEIPLMATNFEGSLRWNLHKVDNEVYIISWHEQSPSHSDKVDEKKRQQVLGYLTITLPRWIRQSLSVKELKENTVKELAKLGITLDQFICLDGSQLSVVP